MIKCCCSPYYKFLWGYSIRFNYQFVLMVQIGGVWEGIVISMKPLIYKIIKIGLGIVFAILIIVFIINRMPGGKSLFNNTKKEFEDIQNEYKENPSGSSLEENESTISSKELWNTDNTDSFSNNNEFSAVIFMKEYEIKSFTVIGKIVPEELSDVRGFGGKEIEITDGQIVSDHIFVKVEYTIIDPLCETDFMGNIVTIMNKELKETCTNPVKMTPFIYEPINPKHFHYNLEKNEKYSFTNYYVIPENFLDDTQKWETYILVNPNGLPDSLPGVTDAMFLKVYLGSFEGKQESE